MSVRFSSFLYRSKAHILDISENQRRTALLFEEMCVSEATQDQSYGFIAKVTTLK